MIEEKRFFSIRQGKYNIKSMRNDATAAIIPHKCGSFITSHRMKSELENYLPFSESIIECHRLICKVLHMTTSEKQKQCACVSLKGIQK